MERSSGRKMHGIYGGKTEKGPDISVREDPFASEMLAALILIAILPAVVPTFFNLGCSCPPPPLCLPPIQLPQLCLPRIELPQIQLCNTCGRKKREANSGNDIQDTELPQTMPDTCNNEKLRQMMEKNMDEKSTPQEAKLRIAEIAEAHFGGHFTVICSRGSFSYLSTTSIFCLRMIRNLNCYAFHTDNKKVKSLEML